MASLKKSKKHLSFGALREALSEYISNIPDLRNSSKCDYSQHDVVMSAFGCMYFQDPSISEFQRRMEEAFHHNNFRNLFQVEKIPAESQLRDILDTISSEQFTPVFADYYERLRRHKHLEAYTLSNGLLLCAIDGTQYHSSTSIHCDCCLSKTHRNGEITYSHTVLQGAIMHPDKKQVIPLMPEAIKNGDGSKKQDCEINAAKRFVQKLKSTHPRQGYLICGDGLMSHQPMIEEVLEQGMHYLFVAKPGDHTYLIEWIQDFRALPSLEFRDDKGRLHQYRWQNQVPLNARDNATQVNYLEYALSRADGKTTYRNSWVTDLEVTEDNVIELVRAGRCRWKIENECFNTLKNQGYHIEHNYGHGKQHLSYNMYLLTLLAFFYHQIFELTDGLYQACRKKGVSKSYLWESLRGTIRVMVVESWEQLLDLFLDPDSYTVTVTKMS